MSLPQLVVKRFATTKVVEGKIPIVLYFVLFFRVKGLSPKHAVYLFLIRKNKYSSMSKFCAEQTRKRFSQQCFDHFQRTPLILCIDLLAWMQLGSSSSRLKQNSIRSSGWDIVVRHQKVASVWKVMNNVSLELLQLMISQIVKQ